MGMELEDDEGTLEIDLNQWTIKGKTTKKGFSKQIELLKEILGK